MTGGQVRDCTHPRANHQHGTYPAYVLDKCRCTPCRAARAAYERQRARRNAAAAFDPSYSRLVAAEPVREHLRWLASQDMGLKTVAMTGGIGHGTLSGIVYGKRGRNPVEHRPPRRRVTRDVADRILAVRPQPADGAKVGATGTTRRLQALVALGWSQASLARRLGFHPANFTGLMRGEQAQVREGTRRQVVELYSELSTVPGPSKRARNDATRRGWLVPAWWDDDTIDDPGTQPAGALADPVKRSRLELVEDFLDTRDHHQGDVRLAADRLGVTHAALSKTLYLAKAQGADIAFHNTHKGNAA
ncbi:MAG: hypothetical protein Q7V58_09595 [Actinomycetota bacterium]|nr:hypothetical protein [Actinomycetota bacterium]